MTVALCILACLSGAALFPHDAAASKTISFRSTNSVEFKNDGVEWIYDSAEGERLGGPRRFGPGVAIPDPVLKGILHAIDVSEIMSAETAIEIVRSPDSLTIISKNGSKCEAHFWEPSLESSSPNMSMSLICPQEPVLRDPDLARVRMFPRENGVRAFSLLLSPRIVRAVTAEFFPAAALTAGDPEAENIRLHARRRSAGDRYLFIQGDRKYLSVYANTLTIRGFDSTRARVFDAETLKRLTPPKSCPPPASAASGPPVPEKTPVHPIQKNFDPTETSFSKLDLIGFQDDRVEWNFDYDLCDRMNIMERAPYRFGPGLRISGTLFQALAEALADSTLPAESTAVQIIPGPTPDALKIVLRHESTCEVHLWDEKHRRVCPADHRTLRCSDMRLKPESLMQLLFVSSDGTFSNEAFGSSLGVLLSPMIFRTIAAVSQRMAKDSEIAGCHFLRDPGCRADDYELFINGNRRRIRSIAVRRHQSRPEAAAVDLSGTDLFPGEIR